MMLIYNATIINEGKSYIGSLLIENNLISNIYVDNCIPEHILNKVDKIDATGLWLLPGVIDDQVHFRDPGLTYKGDIESESRAAIAGGVTSFMDMPNTKPQTTTLEALDNKLERASQCAYSNYGFYFGATNDNLLEIKKVDPKKVAGLKVFMGSSTGNMLVDNKKTLQSIFAETGMLIATHCEKEEIIRKNLEYYKEKFGDNIPLKYHPLIRSAEACYRSSAEAVELADKYQARLHVLHLSTEKEMSLFDTTPLVDKKITAEACVHYLWFCDADYDIYGTRIKWNPAIKTAQDRTILRQSLINGKLDIVATDHAPHLITEKQGGCLQAASGGPLVQHSLQIMLELVKQGVFTKELVVDKMCHAPAILFRVHNRGFIKKGYAADLVLVNPNKSYTVTKDNILYKCQWSPFEDKTLSTTIEKTFLNGQLAYDRGELKNIKGEALNFDN